MSRYHSKPQVGVAVCQDMLYGMIEVCLRICINIENPRLIDIGCAIGGGVGDAVLAHIRIVPPTTERVAVMESDEELDTILHSL